jgi:uncharacterized NAD(P)/FAD-binding protein YdhS
MSAGDLDPLPGERRVVIVGAGAAGVTVAIRLLARPGGTPVQIVLVDSAPEPGRGKAYATADPRHLLNVTSARMSVDPAHASDFVDWLARSAPPTGTAEAPRGLFGRYLADRLDTAAMAAGRSRLVRVADRVVGLRRQWCDRGQTTLLLSGSPPLTGVDAVVLALGVRPPDARWAPDALRGWPSFVADPWAPAALTGLQDHGAVLLVGTGLTMVDMAISLSGREGTVHAVSRGGALPSVHRPSAGPVTPTFDPAAVGDLPTLRRLIAEHLRRAVRTGADWRAAMDGLRPLTAPMWRSLSDADRMSFLRHDRRHWNVRRHRMPQASAAHLATMRTEGRLRRHRGEVTRIRTRGPDAEVTLSDGTTLDVRAIIDCTGPVMDLRTLGDPLVDDVMRQGITRPGPLGLGMDTDPAGRLLDRTGRAHNDLWTLGSPRIGTLWETTAFAEIRDQASHVADGVLARLHAVDRPQAVPVTSPAGESTHGGSRLSGTPGRSWREHG